MCKSNLVPLLDGKRDNYAIAAPLMLNDIPPGSFTNQLNYLNGILQKVESKWQSFEMFTHTCDTKKVNKTEPLEKRL